LAVPGRLRYDNDAVIWQAPPMASRLKPLTVNPPLVSAVFAPCSLVLPQTIAQLAASDPGG
jgi:hypothetical protein